MLRPGEIPQTEPLLRVGIVLPQDQFDRIDITIPASIGEYEMLDDSGGKISPPEKIGFKLNEDGSVICLGNSSYRWRLQPVQRQAAEPGYGVRVHGVVAGRGFHWEKRIDVLLPGTVEIFSHMERLVLINELPLEEYLMCVATSEMGSACPPALIEAQTITARSWMLANVEQKHVSLGMDVCNDDCCQRYQGSANLTEHSIKGAKDTFGKVLIFDNRICDARYSKSCGGMMERFSAIWAGEDPPYLQAIPDAPAGFKSPPELSDEVNLRNWIGFVPETFCSPHTVPENELKKYLGSIDEQSRYFRWQFSITQEEIRRLLLDKQRVRAETVRYCKPLQRGASGRITTLEIGYIDGNGNPEKLLVESEYEVRRTMHAGFLYSGCFFIETIGNPEKPERFILHGGGWGHGVGLCQIGALGMALEGYTSEQIVYHYFPGSKLKKIY